MGILTPLASEVNRSGRGAWRCAVPIPARAAVEKGLAVA
jgi:hypothetical protein